MPDRKEGRRCIGRGQHVQGTKGPESRLPGNSLPANLIFQKSVTEKEMGKQSTSNIGFEKQICDAACVLRGNMDASEYKSVVLELIFLKYISDSFEAKYQ